MAQPSRPLVDLLRETADRLATSTDYRWSHFGHCNCGHLAQTVTRLSAAEIHAACTRELTEWSEIPDDYCAGTGLRLEYVLDRLREFGLDRTDLRHLEDLSDPIVLRALPGGHRWLERNRREDAILYLRTWAEVIERQLPAEEPALVEARTELALASTR